ncbi:alpha/beta-hydrolase [Westerdykella ornata]|uniref:Alpha/beta-hydrolase n=1 Tax=Westerdykella ornata TaxID=318751 RepID=A0A6A6J6M3_WESOR|nr:alpha/beta-hydrolase [Westerdykella ornata]KAF2271864.1 alpha/beta-hydrolase [Westerdykella ornata]
MVALGASLLRTGRGRFCLKAVVTAPKTPFFGWHIRFASSAIKPPPYQAPPKQKPKSVAPKEPSYLFPGTLAQVNDNYQLDLFDRKGQYLGIFPPSDLESLYVVHPGDTRFCRLSDGRTLCYADYGSQSANAPVLVPLHGMPGARLWGPRFVRWAENRGIRVISIDRPGYGHSTPNDDMTRLDLAHDLEELLDALQVNHFYVYGVSAGGAYALACARYFPRSRLRATGVMCGQNPHGPGVYDTFNPLAWKLSHFLARNFKELWKLHSGFRHRKIYRIVAQRYCVDDHTIQRMVAKHTGLTPQEIEEAEAAFEALKRAEIYRQMGVGRLVDENNANWGFDLSEIESNPIYIWHGTIDRNTSYTGALWMKNQIKRSIVHFSAAPGKDHYSAQNHKASIQRLLKH